MPWPAHWATATKLTDCFRCAASTGGRSSFGRLGKARSAMQLEIAPEAEQVLRATSVDPKNAMAHDHGNLLTSLAGASTSPRVLQARDRDEAAAGGKLLRTGTASAWTSDDCVCFNDGSSASSRRSWKQHNACVLHLATGSGGGRSGDYVWPCIDAVDDAPGRSPVRLRRVRHRTTTDCSLHARMGWCGALNSAAAYATPVLIIGQALSCYHRRANRLQPS